MELARYLHIVLLLVGSGSEYSGDYSLCESVRVSVCMSVCLSVSVCVCVSECAGLHLGGGKRGQSPPP